MTELSGQDLFWLLVEAISHVKRQEDEIWKKFERLTISPQRKS